MYGMPDSIVVGTARRAKRFMSKKTNKTTIRDDINWVWGWVGMGIIWVIGYIIIGVVNLFS
jgi:hypothetical protein